MRTAFTGISNNFLIKAGLKDVRSGDILSVKILENKNGLIKATVGGKIISLKGGKDLTPGILIRVRARWNGKTLYLDPQRRLPSGLPGTAGDGPRAAFFSTIYQAAGRAGLQLKQKNVDMLKRFLRSKERPTVEDGRAAAECIKKGLEPEALEAVFARYGEPRRDNDDPPELLFNHMKNEDELWFIMPYNFDGGDGNMQGSLRFCRNLRSGKITTEVIEAGIRNRRVFFLIENPQSDSRRIRVFTEGAADRSLKKQIKIALPEILGNTDCKFDDNIIENCIKVEQQDGNRSRKKFDGFSYETEVSAGVEEIV